jgi:hypothetical protein
MIDIETLGIRPGSIITEIAAAAFTIDGDIIEEIDYRIDILDSLELGLVSDADTIRWHRSRGTAVRGGPNTGTVSNWTAYSCLRMFLDAHRPTTVWAWGMDFERAHLEALGEHLIQGLPWAYQKSRDARTAWNLVFPGMRPTHKPHTALEDVRIQVRDLCKALAILQP